MTKELLKLENINVESGVSAFDGKPFCRIECRSSDGSLMVGQLNPIEVQAMALNWLTSAEAAMHDAASIHFLTKIVNLDEVTAAQFLGELRALRETWEGKLKDE